ncbi:hypothetical protein IU449_10995 [Nocardia higoensis]|uniref:Translation initiation factor n=1 Tax=Nocardia higoensis TaxID=228599 RepID=A0ABS0DEB7_9NOCA|nr:DUF6319 family protein [Nocardia higoensis]MBF6355063.1 hypothetical protein [Nocardia higoensis]
MPSPRNKPTPLSDSEIQHIAAEIAAGRPPMVWFTAAAVGVAEGRSGKVVALGDPAEGDFLQVRPTGSRDVLSFSPVEVTVTKPPREKAAAAPGRAEPAPRKETPVTQPPSPTSAPVAKESAPRPAQDAAKTQPAKTAAPAPDPAASSRPAAKAAKAPARKAKAPEVSVTLAGTADGEWTVEVVTGKKRSVRGLPVSSAAVAQAAKLLHPEVAEVVAGILDAAREAQLAKVAQLQAELEAAKRALEDLDS